MLFFMTIVSSKEFATRPARYYHLALNEQVIIKRGKNMFHLTCVNGCNTIEYDDILAPDEDFQRAIPADEFRVRLVTVLDQIDKKYANKCK